MIEKGKEDSDWEREQTESKEMSFDLILRRNSLEGNPRNKVQSTFAVCSSTRLINLFKRAQSREKNPISNV